MAAIDPQTPPDAEQVRAELHNFVRGLFTLCRSIRATACGRRWR